MRPARRPVEVSDGIVAVLHGDGGMGVANAALVIDDRAALAVDAMLLPEMAGTLAAEAVRRGRTVDVVLNTHHHVDHVGGNGAFPGARLVAHPETARIVRLMAADPAALGAVLPAFAADLRRLTLVAPEPALEALTPPRGGRLLAFTPAHSPADVALWLPEDRVLLAGDLCFNEVVPLAVQGDVGAWAAALDELLALRPAVVVPGHGPLATMDHLAALRAYLGAVLEAAAAVCDGAAPEEALAATDLSCVAGWREPARTRINLDRAVQRRDGLSPRSRR